MLKMWNFARGLPQKDFHIIVVHAGMERGLDVGWEAGINSLFNFEVVLNLIN